MKKTTISMLLLLMAAFTLSGCIFPYWDGYGYEGGHGGGRHDNGNHGGRGRR